MANKKHKEKNEASQTGQPPETEVELEETAPAEEEPSELDLLKEENEQLKEAQLRQLAEFDNYRKRTQREKAETYSNATATCVKEFIAVYDNLERALEAAGGNDEFANGVQMICKQFKEVLVKAGVEEINPLNEVFNPLYQNAVNQIEDENFGENTVCQVFQKGYKMGDKVIRHAMVVVANP